MSHAWKLLYRCQPGFGSLLARALRNAVAANTQAYREYVPRVYPGRVTLFRALQPLVGSTCESDMGWRRLAGGGLEIHEVPGDHISVIAEPHVRILAEQLKICLDKAQADGQSIQV